MPLVALLSAWILAGRLQGHGPRCAGRAVMGALATLGVAPAAADDALPPEQLVPAITAQVLQVWVSDGGLRTGSAVQVERDLAVTNCHVMGAAREARVGVGLAPVAAALVAADRRHDLCLLALPAGERAIATRRASQDVRDGELSYSVGFASGRLGYSRGPVLARYAMDGGAVLRTRAGFLGGASGGGLFDAAGRLVGVLTTFRRIGEDSVYLAVPTEWIDDLVAAHRAGRAVDVAARPFWDLTNESVAAPLFMQALVQQAPPQRPALTDLVRLDEVDDAQCQHYGGRLVVLRLADPSQGVRVSVERWFLGVKTADRGRHELRAGAAPVPLGCSRNGSGEQRWEIHDAQPLPAAR